MKIEFVPYKITMDAAKVKAVIQPYVLQALEKIEEKYIELMGIGIDETSTAPQHWRDGIKTDLKHIDAIITGSIIEYVCGLDYAEGTGAWMRAMVIAYGMGKLGLNGNKIMAGPKGRIVWDGELENQIPSSVENEHEIPQSWYHAGGWFLQNATSKMRTLFGDIAEDVFSSIPKGALLSCVTVTTR